MDRKDDTSRPQGVPLEDLAARFSARGEEVRVAGDTLYVTRGRHETTVHVRAPRTRSSAVGTKHAVVEVRHPMPADLSTLFAEASDTAAINRIAASGALTRDDEGHLYVGSRLTIMESEAHAWPMHGALLDMAASVGAAALIEGMRALVGADSSMPAYALQPFGGRQEAVPRSAWRAAEFQLVVSELRQICAASGGGLNAVAEFPLADGQVSAVVGHPRTALWKATAEEPHPALGGGLLCLLQLPASASSDEELAHTLEALNRREMEDEDGPPHFGAWCEGRGGGNPAYVSFLPNAMHETRGIALNMACWAVFRARRAQAWLASRGFGEGAARPH
jgi:hypothetical protein